MEKLKPLLIYPEISIGGRKIGLGHPSFIIAEISANHHQKFDEAVKIVKASAWSGCDAVKLQTFTPDSLTFNSNKDYFIVKNKKNPNQWQGQTLFNLYKKAYTPWEWVPKLQKLAKSLGLILFSTPQDEKAIDFLEGLEVPCYKVASYEATHIPLLKKIAVTGKPVIISVGFATLEEVTEAIDTLRAGGTHDIAVLHCVTQYAGDPDLSSINLSTITDIRDRFGVVSGFSDNNGGTEAPILAVAAGASIIEKHIILDRNLGGLDTDFSLEPKEMKKMVEKIRRNEKFIGNVHYGSNNISEEENKRYRRSIFVSAPIHAGEIFTKENIQVVRPASGLPPKYFEEILGKSAAVDIEFGIPLSWDMIRK